MDPTYETITETRRRVAPDILCIRCLVGHEKDRLVCRQCVDDLRIIRMKARSSEMKDLTRDVRVRKRPSKGGDENEPEDRGVSQ